MRNSMLNRIKDSRRDSEITRVNIYNDGHVNDDNYSYVKNHGVLVYSDMMELKGIEDVLSGASSCYTDCFELDSVRMKLRVGLVYDRQDVDDEYKPLPGREPLNGKVRYYTHEVDALLDGEKVNKEFNYYTFGRNRQGYINYGRLVSSLRHGGLIYDGPETFEELKERILSGEHFDITVTADFKEKTVPHKLEKKPEQE